VAIKPQGEGEGYGEELTSSRGFVLEAGFEPIVAKPSTLTQGGNGPGLQIRY
jgi:hypothetical protein